MRIIGHLDMDAFFAAIEERDRSRLKGLPIAVGADPQGGTGRGIVSTANYKAREYGIRSALPISTAWRLSEEAKREGRPEVVFLEPNFKKYSQASENIIAILSHQLLLHSTIVQFNSKRGDGGRAQSPLDKASPANFVPKLERASVDEAYFDLSFSGSYEAAQEICEKIKKEIKKEEKLTCSVGIGPNKLIAKIASDMHKPDGLTIVREEDAEKFLEPLSIRKIPGIGPKTEEILKKKGVKSVSDARKFSEHELLDLFGKCGGGMYQKIRGNDDSPIVEEAEAKSIGEQETFEVDSRDPSFLTGRLRALCVGVFERFSESDFDSFKTIIVTIRFADFTTKNRSYTLPEPTDELSVLEFESLKLFMPFLDARENPQKKAVRLIGVRVEKLE